VELIEGTKLRLYSRLMGATVARGWARDFRVRKQVRKLHAVAGEIVQEYMRARSGGAAAAADSAQVRPDSSDGLPAPPFSPSSYAFGRPPLPGLSLPSSLPSLYPAATPELLGSLTDDSYSSQPLNILTARRALPATAAAAARGNVGSPTHSHSLQALQPPRPHSAGPASSSVSTEQSIVLQAEVGEWYRQSCNVLRYGRRAGPLRSYGTQGAARPRPLGQTRHHQREPSSWTPRVTATAAHEDTQLEELAARNEARRQKRREQQEQEHGSGHVSQYSLGDFALDDSLPQQTPVLSTQQSASTRSSGPHLSGVAATSELLLCLADVGPVLRCMQSSSLSGLASSRATLASFQQRVVELQGIAATQAQHRQALQQEQEAMQAYEALLGSQVAELYAEAAALGQLTEQHRAYEANLRRAVKAVNSARERRAIEARKEARKAATLAAASEAASEDSESQRVGAVCGSTGGLGVSSTLLRQAQEAVRARAQQERQALLQEVLHTQHTAMASVARQAKHNQQSMVQATQPWTASSSAATSSTAQNVSGAASSSGRMNVDTLLSLQQSQQLPAPHLEAFLHRRREQVREGMRRRGVAEDDLPPPLPPLPQQAKDAEEQAAQSEVSAAAGDASIAAAGVAAGLSPTTTADAARPSLSRPGSAVQRSAYSPSRSGKSGAGSALPAAAGLLAMPRVLPPPSPIQGWLLPTWRVGRARPPRCSSR